MRSPLRKGFGKVEGVIEIAADAGGGPPFGRELKIPQQSRSRRKRPALDAWRFRSAVPRPEQ